LSAYADQAIGSGGLLVDRKSVTSYRNTISPGTVNGSTNGTPVPGPGITQITLNASDQATDHDFGESTRIVV